MLRNNIPRRNGPQSVLRITRASRLNLGQRIPPPSSIFLKFPEGQDNERDESTRKEREKSFTVSVLRVSATNLLKTFYHRRKREEDITAIVSIEFDTFPIID